MLKSVFLSFLKFYHDHYNMNTNNNIAKICYILFINFMCVLVFNRFRLTNINHSFFDTAICFFLDISILYFQYYVS